jgi:AmmeMemoRadiSam system protein B
MSPLVISPLREPAVAGAFYPDDPVALRRDLAGFMPERPRRRALGVVVPHAGYVYSGRVAGETYARVEVPRDVVLLCFHHRGRGAPIAVWPAGAWRTPLGDAPVNADLARAVLDGCPGAAADETGHLDEHSGEVQVPFLQAARTDVRLVPVALSGGLSDGDVARLEAFGRALAGLPGDFLVVASTDLNHYEDQETTLVRDAEVIGALERLDGEGVRSAVRGGVSMCGYAPSIALCAYAKARGASKADVVRHATSGDAGGDLERVVGYVGMIIGRN